MKKYVKLSIILSSSHFAEALSAFWFLLSWHLNDCFGARKPGTDNFGIGLKMDFVL